MHQIERLRTAAGAPLLAETAWLPAALLPEFLAAPLQGSLWDALAAAGHRVARAVEHLEPVLAGADEALLLEVEVGAPLMLVERTSYDAAGVAVEHAVEHVPGRPDAVRGRGPRRAGSGRSATLTAVRVAITGIGVIGPHGVGTDRFWEALCEGRSGIRKLTAPALQGLEATAGGEIPDFDATAFMERRVARRMGRFSQLAVAATALALADAGIAELDAERTGITVHTGAGGIIEGDRELLARAGDPGRIGPLYVPLLSANMGAANVAIQFGVTGPVTAGVGACAAGAIGVAEGYHLLRRGEADVVLAGASDAALTAPLVACLSNAGALSTASGDPEKISRPVRPPPHRLRPQRGRRDAGAGTGRAGARPRRGHLLRGGGGRDRLRRLSHHVARADRCRRRAGDPAGARALRASTPPRSTASSPTAPARS